MDSKTNTEVLEEQVKHAFKAIQQNTDGLILRKNITKERLYAIQMNAQRILNHWWSSGKLDQLVTVNVGNNPGRSGVVIFTFFDENGDPIVFQN